MRRTLFPTLLTAAALATAVLAISQPARATDLDVAMDEVRTVTFPTPVATVYVGNPAIADINMIDARHAFVLGKAFGSTNIVALDHGGTQIANDRVTVLGRTASVVTLNLGASRVTYNCAAERCEAAPVPGDARDAFDQALDQINKHQDLSKKAAVGQ